MGRSIKITQVATCFFTILLTSTGRGTTVIIPNRTVDLRIDPTIVEFPVAIVTDPEEGFTARDFVTDMAAVIFSEMGGTLTGNSPAPPIVDVSYAGSIWENLIDAPGGFTSFFGDSPPPAEFVDPNVSLNVVHEAVPAEGVLLTFFVDVTSFSAGQTFSMSMSIPDLMETQLFDAGAVVPAKFVDGSLTITPEPGGLVLAMWGFLVVTAGRWYRVKTRTERIWKTATRFRHKILVSDARP